MKATIHAKGTEIAMVSGGKEDDFIFLMDPNSNRVEFDSVKKEADSNAFVLLGNAVVKRLEGRK